MNQVNDGDIQHEWFMTCTVYVMNVPFIASIVGIGIMWWVAPLDALVPVWAAGMGMEMWYLSKFHSNP